MRLRSVKITRQTEQSGSEDVGGHRADLVYADPEWELVDDVGLSINSRRHPDQLQTVSVQSKNSSFSDVEHTLPAPTGLFSTKRDLIDFSHKFPVLTFRLNAQTSVTGSGKQPPGSERSTQDDGRGILAAISESTGADHPPTELRDIHVTSCIDLSEAEEGNIQPSAVIEVELCRLVEDRSGVRRDAEDHSPRWNASDQTLLDGESEPFRHALLRCDCSDPGSDTHPKVHDVASLDFAD